MANIFLASNVWAIFIEHNITMSTMNELILTSLTVRPEVYFSVINSNLFTVLGLFKNEGNINFTSSSSRTTGVRITGEEFENLGNVILNSLSNEAFSEFHITLLGSFQNTGNIYFGIQGGSYETAPFSVTSVTEWYNTGIMVFAATYGMDVRLDFECRSLSNELTSIVNDGTVCLNNTLWPVKTTIEGIGCITLGSGGQLDLQYSQRTYAIAAAQTVYLASFDSILKVTGWGLFEGNIPVIKIAGFGNSNLIQLHTYSVNGFRYSLTTGMLTVRVGDIHEVNFDIGTGYIMPLFRLTSSAIYYRGNPPQSPPEICFCATTFPTAPRALVL
ncbi:hypothetical protein METBIDRAFT_30159, partial [Metschnikowia bicuspidata var. bicuspidata NRRL YB-4993]